MFPTIREWHDIFFWKQEMQKVSGNKKFKISKLQGKKAFLITNGIGLTKYRIFLKNFYA